MKKTIKIVLIINNNWKWVSVSQSVSFLITIMRIFLLTLKYKRYACPTTTIVSNKGRGDSR